MPTCMERVQKLSGLIRERISGVTIAVDPPSLPRGDWFIDIKRSDRFCVVELRPARGFGLSSTPGEGFGEGPDEIFEDELAVIVRVAELLGATPGGPCSLPDAAQAKAQ